MAEATGAETNRDVAYRVVVTRETEYWLARMPGLSGAHTFAKTLRKLDTFAREVIVLAADLPASARRDLKLDYEFHTGDPALDELVSAAREARHAAAREERRARRLSDQVIASAGANGLSRRDLAVLLDLSYQRVQQLAAGAAAPAVGLGTLGMSAAAG